MLQWLTSPPQTIYATTFLQDILPGGPWLLVSANGHKTVAIQQCVNEFQAAAFLQRHIHKGRIVRVAMADVANGATISQDRLPPFTRSRYLAIAVPDEPVFKWKAEKILPPSIWLRHKGDRRQGIERHIIAAWRFDSRFGFPAYLAARKALADLANRIDPEKAKPLPELLPVPDVGSPCWVREELRFDRDTLLPVLDSAGKGLEATAAPKPQEKKKADERRFVRGDEDDDEAETPDIKDDWIASENFTLYVGRPKQGKSLAVAKTAAYITAGGTWDGDGKWTDTWFDGAPILPHARGSVIIGEQEDKVSQTKARCRAAGCNMSKVHIRKILPDISIAEQLKEWTDLAEELGDCRMMSFSPLQEALKVTDNSEAAVRRKISPILSWADGKGIALIGVLHINKDGRVLAGPDVLLRAARCVVEFGDGVMRVRDSNIGPTGLQIPFAVETIMSKGVKTARINFCDASATLGLVAPSGKAVIGSLIDERLAAQSEPRKRYTAAEMKCVEFLMDLIPSLDRGGLPIDGSRVRRIAREQRGITNIPALLMAADALGIKRVKREGAPMTEPDLWVPPSQYPAEFSPSSL